MNRRMRPWLTAFAASILALISAGVTYQFWHAAQSRSVDGEFSAAPAGHIEFSGALDSLAITPLVNWRTAGPQFISEPGVSYLIETDQGRILFDVGFNQKQSSPSPIEHNMRALGLTLKSFDWVFISHLHRDHVGGVDWERRRSFAIGRLQEPLSARRLFAPVTMTYPGLQMEVTAAPRELIPGVATTGAIARQLAIGRADEQALVLNLKGRGLVIVVGCGHQRLDRLLQRVRATFRTPIYAIVGDLHYPIEQGRLFIAGIDAQRRLASGQGILSPITAATVEREIALLRKEVRRVVVGGHDTGDEALAKFRSAFKDDFVEARVGATVRFDAPSR
jgi:7,8-dihydropterin-6-yl-methyl-4-(beta-D-ribofuranosyl)aminobenzene 5'-phosphate synthase